MERLDGTKSENRILRGMFRSAESSYVMSEFVSIEE